MAFRTPDTVPNERTSKGGQPYKDEREEMAQKESDLRTKAEDLGESQKNEPAGDRLARMESDAEERFEEIQEDRSNR
ncbi:MAG TPA: hypothetical protein VHR64_07375 [Thermomicrobiales bacterium]|jgi:hypothetical protein|nr:hypothetical protein [Thermomicrobiales bacterium]